MPRGFLARERFHQLDDVRARLGVALAALDLLAGSHALASPSCGQLGDESRLFEFGDVAQHLFPERFRSEATRLDQRR